MFKSLLFVQIADTILVGVPIFCVLMFVNKRRIENQSLRIDYVKYIKSLSTTDLKFNMKNEINYLKSFMPLRAEAMAFSTLILPFVMGIGLTVENDASVLVNCIAGLIVFSLIICIYLVLDIAFWLFVHKNWLKYLC